MELDKQEAISDLDAARLKSEGLITDAEESALNFLNQTKSGAIETLRDIDSVIQGRFDVAETEILSEFESFGYLERQVLESAAGRSRTALDRSQANALSSLAQGAEAERSALEAGLDRSVQTLEDEKGLILEDIAASGAIERDEINSGALDSIAAAIGFGNRAEATLQPFRELGLDAALQQRVFQGIATEQDLQEYDQRFGENAIQESPLFQFRLSESERLLDRRQKALGRTFSGRGVEEFIDNTDRLTAEESQRRFDNAANLTNLGLTASQNIAGIQQQTGQQVVGINQARTGAVVDSLRNENALRVGARTNISGQVASAQQQAGRDVASSFRGQANAEAAVEREFGLTLAQLETQFGSQVAQSLANQAVNTSNVRQAFTQNRANQSSQLGANLSNIELGIGQQQANISTQAGLNLSNLETGIAQSKSNVRLGASSNIANIATAGAQAAANASARAADFSAQARLAPFQGLTAGLDAFSRTAGFNQGLQGA